MKIVLRGVKFIYHTAFPGCSHWKDEGLSSEKASMQKSSEPQSMLWWGIVHMFRIVFYPCSWSTRWTKEHVTWGTKNITSIIKWIYLIIKILIKCVIKHRNTGDYILETSMVWICALQINFLHSLETTYVRWPCAFISS